MRSYTLGRVFQFPSQYALTNRWYFVNKNWKKEKVKINAPVSP